jgi:hypothetical protein
VNWANPYHAALLMLLPESTPEAISDDILYLQQYVEGLMYSSAPMAYSPQGLANGK